MGSGGHPLRVKTAWGDSKHFGMPSGIPGYRGRLGGHLWGWEASWGTGKWEHAGGQRRFWVRGEIFRERRHFGGQGLCPHPRWRRFPFLTALTQHGGGSPLPSRALTQDGGGLPFSLPSPNMAMVPFTCQCPHPRWRRPARRHGATCGAWRREGSAGTTGSRSRSRSRFPSHNPGSPVPAAPWIVTRPTGTRWARRPFTGEGQRGRHRPGAARGSWGSRVCLGGCQGWEWALQGWVRGWEGWKRGPGDG